jgi:hypothetical protein
MAEPEKPAAPPPGSVTLYDKTGAPVVVDAADAPGHIMSGQLGYASGTRIPVRVNGEIGTIDADHLQSAIGDGSASPVTGKEFHQAQLQREYGSTSKAAQAFALNAADSASLGLSNALIGGIGGQETREYMRNITEANPTASTAGDVAGFVAPIAADVLSAGTLTPALAAAETARVAARAGGSAAERMAAHTALRVAEEAAGKGLARTGLETAGKVITAPTKLVTGVGDAAAGVAKSIVGSEAKSGAARLAQNIVAGGARGLAEGGLYGVGQEAGHQYLQDDPDFTGESLGNAWWHGAVLGGGLGGVLHGVGGMLTKKAPALVEAEEKALYGAAEGKVASAAKAESTVADKAAETIIGQVDDPQKAQLLKDAWKHRSFEGHDGLLADATRKVTSTLDDAIESGRVVDMSSFGEAKSNQMAKLVPAENLKPARDMALQVWTDSKKVIEELESQTMKGGAEGSVKRLRRWLDDFGNVPKNEWNSAPELFDKIDDFKRRVGKEAGFGRGVFGREEATNAFNALYENVLRPALQDEATWGAAAVAQKEINLATANMIDTNGKFLQKFTSQYGTEAVTGAPKYIADSAKVNGFINGLTSAANDTNAKMAADYVAKRSQFLDAVTKNYDLAADALAAVKKERASLASMSETIEKTSNEVSRANQLKSLMADERGHSIHGIVGLAIDAVTKPGLTLARLAELEATKNRAIAKIDSGLDSVKRALGGSGERKKPGLAPKMSDSPDTYDKRRAAVIGAASKADDLHANLTGAVAPVNPSAPATAKAFQSAGIRTVQYLVAELPKPQPQPGSLTPRLDAENWKASDQQQAEYNEKFDAATHPTQLLHNVANGTITTTQVEAVRQTSPAMLAHQQQKLQRELDILTKPVPIHMEAPIKTLLGMPQMDPGLQKLLQSSPPAQQRQALPKKPLKMADNTTLNASNLK